MTSRIISMTLGVALLGSLAGAASEAPPDRGAILAKVTELLRAERPYAAIDHVQALGAPPVVAKAYHELVTDLHWKAKDVPGVVVLGRAGVLYCLTKGRELAATDTERARAWIGHAKTISYNVGSFAWPGWGEQGCVYSESDMLAGRAAARLNLRLATELGRPAKARSAARWLVGAYAAAVGETDEALKQFAEAKRLAGEAEDAEGALMNEGYAAVAEALAGRKGAEGRLEKAHAALMSRGTDDAGFYAEQLKTVRTALAAWRKGKGSGR